MDMVKVKLYRDLKAEAKRLGAEADGVKEEAAKLERELLEVFADEGVQNVKVDGSTVYLHRALWAQKEAGVTTEDVVEGLKEAGLHDFVAEGFNTNTLSGYLRDLDRADEAMPPALVGKVKAAEVFSIRCQGL